MNIVKSVHAITNPIITNSQAHLANPEGFFNNALQAVIGFFFLVGTIYFIWHIVMATYHFMASEGDKGKFQEAKSELTNAVIGIAVLYSIFALLKLIGDLFGVDGLNVLELVFPTIN